MSDFKTICSMLAARDLFFAGVEVKDIASQSKRSVDTVREWIKTVCRVHSWETAVWLRDRFMAEQAEAERMQPSFCFD